MPSVHPVGDIRQALAERLYPSVTTWDRLEARPRTIAFDRALRAEVRDPLWMLTKQWQMGEFRGSDAGSPVYAKLKMDTTRLTTYQPDGQAARALEDGVPIEATVEQRPIPLTSGGRLASLDLRLAMGRYWLALIDGIGSYRQAFVEAYPVPAPDPADEQDADRCAQPEVWQLFSAVAGHAMDGGALYSYLAADPAHHAYDGVAAVDAQDFGAIDLQAARFTAWFGRLLLQPAPGDDAWIPSRLEYQFTASAPLPASPGAAKAYVASEYYQGSLDWYSVDVVPAAAPGAGSGAAPDRGPADAPRTMIPVPVSFAGMPNTRWWAFEDARTNFGDIDASTTDLAKLLFLDFALVYANDWFVIPYTLPAGAIATISGLVVTNTFGDRLWIAAAGRGDDDAWQRWSMFSVNVAGDAAAPADTSLLLLPDLGQDPGGPARPRTSGWYATRWRTWSGRWRRRCRWPAATASRGWRRPGRRWLSTGPSWPARACSLRRLPRRPARLSGTRR